EIVIATFSSVLLTPLLLMIVGVGPLVLSSILPFGIPPVPAAMIVICLGIPTLMLAGSKEKLKLGLFALGTLVVFVIALIAMYRTHSTYGWYIPAISVAVFQTITLEVIVVRDREWLVGFLLIASAIGLPFLLQSITIFITGFQWYIPLILYIAVATLILSGVQRALLPLLGFFSFFVLGAVWKADYGAVAGGLLYGYLLLLGGSVVGNNEASKGRIARCNSLVKLLGEHVQRLGDRFVFSPALLR